MFTEDELDWEWPDMEEGEFKVIKDVRGVSKWTLYCTLDGDTYPLGQAKAENELAVGGAGHTTQATQGFHDAGASAFPRLNP